MIVDELMNSEPKKESNCEKINHRGVHETLLVMAQKPRFLAS